MGGGQAEQGIALPRRRLGYKGASASVDNRCLGLTTYEGVPFDRAPKDQINIRILQNIISGIHLILGLGTRM